MNGHEEADCFGRDWRRSALERALPLRLEGVSWAPLESETDMSSTASSALHVVSTLFWISSKLEHAGLTCV